MERLSPAETASLLPYPELASVIAATLSDCRAGRVVAPRDVSYRLPGGATLLLKTAWDDNIGVLKRVSVHPRNADRSLPLVRAEVTVFDVSSGEPLLLLDGETLTARRTAALSLLAAQTLALGEVRTLLVIGTGVQARAHLEAFAHLHPHNVYVYGRTFSRAAALAAYGRRLGLNSQTVPWPDKAAASDVIVAATSSPQPVVPENAAEKSLVISVGSFTPEMAEAPPQLVKRSRVYVDTLAGAKESAGDLIQAQVDWKDVTPLAKALRAPRPHSGPIFFKSVGSGLFDLAAARLAYGMKST